MSQTIFGLAGQTALVTGAGRGMGVGVDIACMLNRLGAKVIVNDFYAERAEETVAELRKEGIQAFAASKAGAVGFIPRADSPEDVAAGVAYFASKEVS